jgi:putative transposase
MSDNSKKKIQEASQGDKLVSIISYCFMPNHFHFMLRQEVDGGISKFVGQFLNSYTRYFNTKNKRVGGLFLDRFKNVLVISEAQMLHLTRYIHLNPYSSGIVKDLENLSNYEWSSLPEYLGLVNENVCDRGIVESYFKSKESYKKFVFDRAEYQKELKELEE